MLYKPLRFSHQYPQTGPPFTMMIYSKPQNILLRNVYMRQDVFFFFCPTPWPRGCHPHCTPYSGLTILSRCSAVDTASLGVSPLAVRKDRHPTPPPGCPTNRSRGAFLGHADQGMARVPSSRRPRLALYGGVHRSSIYSPFEYTKGCLCRRRGCQQLPEWICALQGIATASMGGKAARTTC